MSEGQWLNVEQAIHNWWVPEKKIGDDDDVVIVFDEKIIQDI